MSILALLSLSSFLVRCLPLAPDSGIYVHEKNVKKSKGYLSMMAKVPNTITQRDKTLHAQQRRLLSHGFSDAALRAYEDPLHAHINNFCEVVGEFKEQSPINIVSKDDQIWSEPKNMADWCMCSRIHDLVIL